MNAVFASGFWFANEVMTGKNMSKCKLIASNLAKKNFGPPTPPSPPPPNITP